MLFAHIHCGAVHDLHPNFPKSKIWMQVIGYIFDWIKLSFVTRQRHVGCDCRTHTCHREVGYMIRNEALPSGRRLYEIVVHLSLRAIGTVICYQTDIKWWQWRKLGVAIMCKSIRLWRTIQDLRAKTRYHVSRVWLYDKIIYYLWDVITYLSHRFTFCTQLSIII